MSGSSRSIIRALDTLFVEWNKSKNHHDIDQIIDQYVQKHNELSIIQQSTSLNDELYKLYNRYIQPSENIEQEYKFLDVLRRVSLVFNQEEIDVWLQTYLKPCLDSAGFDLLFVEKARDFINNLINYVETNDVKLNFFRKEMAKSIIDQIINIYLQNSILQEKLNISTDSDYNHSQIYHERVRFIKSNCKTFLSFYGDKHCIDYCEILNKHLLIPNQRLETLILISVLVNNGKASSLVETELFSNLLKCVVYEFDDAVVHGSLTILNMLIPQITKNLGIYLPDLFAIYCRLISWNDFNTISNRQEIFHEYVKTNWKMSKLDKDFASTSLSFDHQYLFTLIYGLYYKNVLDFIKAPMKYFTNYTPRLFPMSFLEVLNNKLNLESKIVEKSKNLLSTFSLHPKVINSDDTNELINPISWIEGDSSEEIATACLSLNPNILVNKFRSPVEVEIESQKVSRNSSLAGPMYININNGLQAKLQNIQNRKMSIIPTNLVIESANESANVPDIKFKEVKFGDNTSDTDVKKINSIDSYPSSPEILHHEPKSADPILDLLSTHEKLFGSASKTTTTSLDSYDSKTSLINEKLKHELRLSRPMSSPTTNIETSSVFKGVNDSKGNVVDFYQRELLLYKNELEFSSYIKYLNQYHYFKMKKVKTDTFVCGHEEELRDLKSIVSSVKDELLNSSKDFTNERNTLIDKVQTLEKEKEEMASQINTLSQREKSDSQKLTKFLSDLSNKNYEIEELKLRTTESLEEKAPLKEVVKIVKEPADDKTIFDLNTQIRLIKDKYDQAVKNLNHERKQQDELSKRYQEELKQSKFNINENIAMFTSQYEKKIQELSTIILKYETLLEEKDSRIMQLSTSKPIPIGINGKSSNSSRMSSRSDSYDHLSSSFSPPSNQHIPYNVPPPNTYKKNSNPGGNSTSAVPIMRGRGGIQKRSKKMM